MIKLLFLVLMICSSVPALAGEMTLNFEGIDDYEEKSLTLPIEVLGWSFASSGPSGAVDKSDERVGVRDLSLTKKVGLETPHLMKLLALRKNIKKVTLTVNTENKMVLVLKNARVTRQLLTGSKSEVELTESIDLSFTDLEMQISVTVGDKQERSTAAVSAGR